jgi:hypothetical protein
MKIRDLLTIVFFATPWLVVIWMLISGMNILTYDGGNPWLVISLGIVMAEMIITIVVGIGVLLYWLSDKWKEHITPTLNKMLNYKLW